MDIMSLTAVELGKKIKAKEISVTEATQAYLDQIEKVENDVHSYVTIDKEGALKRAEEVQKMIDDGTLLSPLAGVPVERLIWMNSPWEVQPRLLIME